MGRGYSRLLNAAFALAITICMVASGCAKKPAPTATPIPPPATPPSQNNFSEGGEVIRIYLPMLEGDEIRLQAKEVRMDKTDAPLKPALEKLIEAKVQEKSLFPEGTKINSVSIKDGIASIDFNEAFTTFDGGSSEEAALLNAIAFTATQFPTVKSVKITAEGKDLETLGGHADLTIPLQPDKALLAKGSH